MKLIKPILIASIFCGTHLLSPAAPPNTEGREIMRTLTSQLSGVSASKDSLLLLENLFDLSQTYHPAKSDSIAELTYNVALRAGDTACALDMLRQRGNIYSQVDSMLIKLIEVAEGFPPSVDQAETLTFLKMQLNSYNARNLDDDERQSRFHEELRLVTVDPPEDVYEQIVLLHSVCVNISQTSQGELLAEYMDRLWKLIESLKSESYTLKNIFYVQSAMGYSEAGQAEKALKVDRQLLAVMDTLEYKYSKAGRPYRYYDGHRYLAYTRMLSNWAHLEPELIEKYYRKAIAYRNRSSRAAVSYSYSPRPSIYYAMANKDYAKAKELILGSIDNPVNKKHRRVFLKYLVECSRALGDNETLLHASTEYTNILENYLNRRLEERYKELQVVYDVYEMQKQYNALETEKQTGESQNQRLVIFISLCFIVVLVVLLIICVRQYKRAKNLAHTLAASNRALSLESNNLRQSQGELTRARDMAQKANNFKTDFIKNMSREVAIPLKAITEYSHLIVDCSEASGKPYLERYSELIELNCGLLSSIVNDVLHLSEIESETVTLNSRLVDFYKIVSLSAETAAQRLRKGVTIRFDRASPRLEVYTDPRRVQQILMNLINNAAKFTPEGSITISYDLSNDESSIVLSVTDTGIGIPAEQSERIFERFVKLDKDAQGVGLGLTISRMLARLLGGDLMLDTSYTKGARFVLTLPYRHNA